MKYIKLVEKYPIVCAVVAVVFMILLFKVLGVLKNYL